MKKFYLLTLLLISFIGNVQGSVSQSVSETSLP